MTEVRTFLDGRVVLHVGDCLDVLKTLPENSVHSAVMDPPYHLTSGDTRSPHRAGSKTQRKKAGFMGMAWDGGDVAFRVETWQAVKRVLKPGGYLLAFASTRGFGRMSVAIEDAGFVTHPLIALLMQCDDAQAFLESLSSVQMDMLLRLMSHSDIGGMLGWVFGSGFPKATRIREEGFGGFRYGGQALKPAIEPIYMGQKPFSEKTGTANVLLHGTGAVNIDGCRVAAAAQEPNARSHKQGGKSPGYEGGFGSDDRAWQGDLGRWPANLIHDGSDEVAAAFPGSDSRGGLPKGQVENDSNSIGYFTGNCQKVVRNDTGSAARFFYSVKADAGDRIGSNHPTVKPIDLMRYLCRLVTPPGGTVLDAFAGTGTTGEAAWREGFKAILIEREASHAGDIAARMRLCLSGADEKKREIARRKQAGKAPDHGPLFGGGDAEAVSS